MPADGSVLVDRSGALLGSVGCNGAGARGHQGWEDQRPIKQNDDLSISSVPVQ